MRPRASGDSIQAAETARAVQEKGVLSLAKTGALYRHYLHYLS